jgi:hypothetical protein
MVPLIAEVKQAVVTSGLAPVLVGVSAVFSGLSVEVAEFERCTSDLTQLAWFKKLSKDACATFARLVEEQVVPPLPRRERIDGDLARFDLKHMLNAAPQCRFKRGHEPLARSDQLWCEE